jgi:hypothetical protein
LQLFVAEGANDPYYPRMIFKKLIRVCGEELLKAKRAIAFTYNVVREADERTMDLLMMFLGIR